MDLRNYIAQNQNSMKYLVNILMVLLVSMSIQAKDIKRPQTYNYQKALRHASSCSSRKAMRVSILSALNPSNPTNHKSSGNKDITTVTTNSHNYE